MDQPAQKSLVRLEVTGKNPDAIPVDSFLKIVTSVLQILKSIDIAGSADRRPTVRWEISHASMQSPLSLSFGEDSPRPDYAANVAMLCVNGLQQLENGDSVMPTRFSDRTLQNAKELVAVLNDGIASLIFTHGASSVSPTQRVVRSVEALRANKHKSFGSAEGRLETVSVHKGSQFTLYDQLSGEGIKCIFEQSRLKDLLPAFGKRVRVYGEIQYGQLGHPTSIKIEGPLHIFRDRGELPQAGDVSGIDITNGESSEDFVNHLRDE